MIMLEAEKHMIRIVSNIKFIIENILWFVCKVIILDLAIIISAAIRILKIIRMDDIMSIDEIGVIAVSRLCRCNKLSDAARVRIISDAIVVHQYRGVLVIRVRANNGKIIFSIYWCLGN